MSGADLAKDKEKADRTDEATVETSGSEKADAAATLAEHTTVRQPSSERVLLARLFRYVRPHWRVFALGVVAMMRPRRRCPPSCSTCWTTVSAARAIRS